MFICDLTDKLYGLVELLRRGYGAQQIDVEKVECLLHGDMSIRMGCDPICVGEAQKQCGGIEVEMQPCDMVVETADMGCFLVECPEVKLVKIEQG